MKIRRMIVDVDEFDVDDECLGLAKMMKIHLLPISRKFLLNILHINQPIKFLSIKYFKNYIFLTLPMRQQTYPLLSPPQLGGLNPFGPNCLYKCIKILELNWLFK